MGYFDELLDLWRINGPHNDIVVVLFLIRLVYTILIVCGVLDGGADDKNGNGNRILRIIFCICCASQNNTVSALSKHDAI